MGGLISYWWVGACDERIWRFYRNSKIEVYRL